MEIIFYISKTYFRKLKTHFRKTIKNRRMVCYIFVSRKKEKSSKNVTKMKKNIFLSLSLLLLAVVVGFAQTKKITLIMTTATNKAQAIKVYDDDVLRNSDDVITSGSDKGKIRKSYLGKDESGTHQLTHIYSSPEGKLLRVEIYKPTIDNFRNNLEDDGYGMMSIFMKCAQVYVNQGTSQLTTAEAGFVFMWFKDELIQRQYLRGVLGLPSKDARIFPVTLNTGEKKTLEAIGKPLQESKTEKADVFSYLHKEKDSYTRTEVITTYNGFQFIKYSFAKSDIVSIRRYTDNKKGLLLKSNKTIKKYVYDNDKKEKEYEADTFGLIFLSIEEADAFEKELDVKPPTPPKEEKKKKKR